MKPEVLNRLFEESQVSVRYLSGPFVRTERLRRTGTRLQGKNFSITIARKGAEYRPVLEWGGAAPAVLHSVEFALDRGIPGDWSFFKHGYQSWTVTRSYRPGEVPLAPKRPWYMPLIHPVAVIQDNMNNLPSGRDGEYNSESFVMLKDRVSGLCEFAGVAGGFRDFVYFRVWMTENSIKKMALTYDLANLEIKGDVKERSLEPVLVRRGFEEELFEDYFEGIRKAKSLAPPPRVPLGWCSWYYYFTNITAEDILSNLAVCKKRKLKLDYFQIDDGWQRCVGDWLEMKPGFEGKMKHLADEIHRAGYRAGLWLAPFSATLSSHVFKRHPDWFIKDPPSLITGMKSCAGVNPGWSGGLFFGLDMTNPGAEEYVRRVVRTAVREWGYDVLKLDFLYSASLVGRCRDDSLGRAERLMKGLAAIREEAGNDTFILGCGVPMMQGAGFVQGNRIGEDVAPYWTGKDELRWGGESHVGTRNAVRNTLNRIYMHRRLWLNDPDCLMIRDTDTELTENERKLLRDVICVSNGMLILSDDMKKLHPRKISEIEEAVRLSRKMDRGKAYTLGIMDSAHPDFLLNTAGVLLALNCSDERRTVRPDIDQLTRIFRRNRLKVPTRFTAEGGRRVTLDELAAGIALDGRSSVLLSFSIR